MGAEQNNETKIIVFVGVAFDRKNHKLFHKVVDVDLTTDPNDGRRLEWADVQEKWYDAGRKSILPAWSTPGSMFEAEYKVEDGKTYIIGQPKSIGQWLHKGQVGEMQALSRAVRQEYDAQSDARQQQTKREDLEALEPIRQAYLRANSMQRPFILANAISYITRGTNTKGE